MIWTAHADWSQKVHFIFKLFDFDLNGTLTVDEVIQIFITTCKALATFTNTVVLEKQILFKAASSIFRMADVDHSESLSVEEIKQWVETKPVFMNFLDLYQPKVKVYNNPSIYQNFPMIDVMAFNKEPLETRVPLDKLARDTKTFETMRKVKLNKQLRQSSSLPKMNLRRFQNERAIGQVEAATKVRRCGCVTDRKNQPTLVPREKSAGMGVGRGSK